MPDRTEQDNRPVEEQDREKTNLDQKNEDRPGQREDQTDAVEHHIPAPPKKQKHRKKHWEHLPGSKRKPIRSFKSPGRK